MKQFRCVLYPFGCLTIIADTKLFVIKLRFYSEHFSKINFLYFVDNFFKHFMAFLSSSCPAWDRCITFTFLSAEILDMRRIFFSLMTHLEGISGKKSLNEHEWILERFYTSVRFHKSSCWCHLRLYCWPFFFSFLKHR